MNMKGQIAYSEPYRNRFHYSMRVGWLSDLNGMWYKDGYFHVTHQSDEDALYCLAAEWGHARSKDLLYWEQLPCALRQDVNTVGQAYSGTAVVDAENVSGFGENAVLVFYTDSRLGQCVNILDESTGVFVPYEKNPIIELDDIGKEQGLEPGAQRDPKVFQDPDTKLWYLMVYREREPTLAQVMQMYRSHNLKDWTRIDDFLQDDYHECPAIFQVPVANEPGKKLWVIMAASSRYCFAEFENGRFTAIYDDHQRLIRGFDAYAGQTFVNTPADRTIFMCWLDDWMGSSVETSPFRNAFSVPMELSVIRCVDGGYQLLANPIKELARLHHERVLHLENETLMAVSKRVSDIKNEALDFTVVLDVQSTGAKMISFDIRGKQIKYNLMTGEWSTACTTITIPERACTRNATCTVRAVNGMLKMRMLIDVDALEIFFNDGQALYFEEYGFDQGKPIYVCADAEIEVVLAEVYSMKSIW